MTTLPVGQRPLFKRYIDVLEVGETMSGSLGEYYTEVYLDSISDDFVLLHVEKAFVETEKEFFVWHKTSGFELCRFC
jgi:hypothetical protein